MEEVDPITGATPAWEAFIASLNPDRLERERFRRPKKRERPGSREWKAMVKEHNIARDTYWTRSRRVITDWALELVLAESRGWDEALIPEDVRLAMEEQHKPKEGAA